MRCPRCCIPLPLTCRNLLHIPASHPQVLGQEECLDCRDALSKALYAAAFDWIVGAINRKLDNAPGESQRWDLDLG